MQIWGVEWLYRVDFGRRMVIQGGGCDMYLQLNDVSTAAYCYNNYAILASKVDVSVVTVD